MVIVRDRHIKNEGGFWKARMIAQTLAVKVEAAQERNETTHGFIHVLNKVSLVNSF